MKLPVQQMDAGGHERAADPNWRSEEDMLNDNDRPLDRYSRPPKQEHRAGLHQKDDDLPHAKETLGEDLPYFVERDGHR